MAVGSGFAYYSLSSLLIVQLYDNDVSPFGSDDEIEKYLEERGRGDLWETYIAIGNNDSLRVLMDGAADLTPEDLEPVLILIQGIRKAKGLE